MWQLNATIVPVIAGVLGMIKNRTDKHIKKITGNLSQYEIHKIALCGTAHLLRRVLHEPESNT